MAMRLPRIHLSAELAVGTAVALDEPAFVHVVRVLRLRPGAPLVLFNGSGGEFRAVLQTVDRRTAVVRAEAFSPREAESSLTVTLLQGVSKAEHMDYTLQKAVELGVSAILPVLTERSVINLQDERLARRRQHWQRIVAGACEQSGRNTLPPVLEPLGFQACLEGHRHAGLGLVLDPLAARGLSGLDAPTGSVTLLIGPEGGLTRREITCAQAAGYTRIRLGPRVLRTETAAAAALAAVQILWGDLG